MTRQQFTPNHYNHLAVATCGNCGHKDIAEKLEPIADPGERLCSGDVLPAGQCTACGSFSYVESRSKVHVLNFGLHFLKHATKPSKPSKPVTRMEQMRQAMDALRQFSDESFQEQYMDTGEALDVMGQAYDALEAFFTPTHDNGLADIDAYEVKVRELEAEGMTRSDAQGVVDALWLTYGAPGTITPAPAVPLSNRSLLKCLKRDFEMLDSNEWIPDSSSVAVSIDAIDELLRRDAAACIWPNLHLQIIWGKSHEADDKPVTYSFDTQAELTAFREGCEAAHGWLEYEIVYTDEEL